MRRYPAAVVTVIVLPLLLFSSAHGGFDSAGTSQWRILTNRNFSSEIRLHPLILLMVTIPWSGEARSLMKQLGKLVADQPEKHGHLRLMVVYKNSQKMIADVLGAGEDITLYYYHQSTSYKYHGRFVAEKILYSLNYFMPLQSEEVPLKPLNTKNELESFLNSTDKAVLLIELCGWSSQLFHKRIVKKIASSAQLNYSENDEMLRASLFAEVDERLPFDMKKNQKGLDNEGLSSGFENELTDSHLSGEFCWANSSALEEMDYEAADINLSCTEEEFKQFKSFFSKFKLLARDFFLSPERTRFGLISERSLLPYLGVNTRGAWLVTLQFNGCPSCSMIIETIDDLKNILQEAYSPVMQLDLDGHNPEPAFPASRPSVVLFIDRLSDSPLIREKSKSALDVVRKLAEYYQPSYRMNKGAHHGHSQSPTTQIDSENQGTVISDLPHLRFIKDSSSPKLVKTKDTMEIVIRKGQSISSDQSASYTQGNAVYDALLDFIKKRNLVRKKQTKISLLAKEIGFQLLSDDFEVQVADSSPCYEEHNQLSGTNKEKVLRIDDQTSKLHQQPSEDSVNQNDDLLAKVDEPVIGDGMQAALEDVEDNIPKYLEIDTRENSNTNEDDKSWAQNDMGSLICHDENLLQGTYMEKDSIDASGCSSSSKGAEKKASLVDSSEDFARDGWAQVEEIVMNTNDPTFKPHQEAGEDSVNHNELKIMSIGDQTFNLHLQPIEDSVNQNDDLLFAVEDHVVDNCKQAALEDADDVQKYQQTATEENNNTNNKSCEQNDMGSLICHDKNSLLEREVHSVGICMEKDTVDAFGCKSISNGTKEKLSVVGPSENFTGGDAAQAEENMMNKSSKEHNELQSFQYSFFFIDGGYRLLNSLTSGSNIPSLVLLDPVEQQHYVFNEDREIDYSSLIIFVEKFLNGSLSPYQPSASSIMSTKEAPQPPFVNLDFHEVDAIPQVTTNTFCEMVFGFKPCVTENAHPLSHVQHLGAAWKKDVLVLFGSSWCGFCQRMELLVREVFHAFKNLKSMLKCESNVINPMCFQDNIGDMVEYSLPSIFLMDCVQNDCGFFLKAVGMNEHYPQLLLYSAQNKSGIPYEGDMLVVNIIKFLASEGRNSQYLNKHKGYLWKHTSSKEKPIPQDSSPRLVMPQDVSLERRGHGIVTGSVLSATDKLREAIPFDKSTILITMAEEGQQAFQGIIINKPMRWSTAFGDLDKDLEPIKEAPLFYGGPVRAADLPLVSLARNPASGYTKVIPGAYFGNPAITRMTIEGIKSGDRSANEYWFFLGYCSWNGDQIFDELAQGAWHLSDGSIGRLNWPKS